MVAASDGGPVLRAYGPGGPFGPVSACARVFGGRNGIEVAVVKGVPYTLAAWMAEDGDLHYTGAPYMMRDFIKAHPGLLDERSVTDLHARRAGILVRPGNPLRITGAESLARPEVRVLDVALEDMHALRGDPGHRRVPAAAVTTGEQGLTAWRRITGLDAWVTYRSWHVALDDGTEFVPLDAPEALRATQAALVRSAPNPDLAREFVAFMRSDEGHEIFRKYGWE